jgi:hypothetical protein
MSKRPLDKVTLKELRMAWGIKQCTLAQQMLVSAARVSAIEHQAAWDCMVSTLGTYTHMLGGTLELWVAMPDGEKYQLEVDKPS